MLPGVSLRLNEICTSGLSAETRLVEVIIYSLGGRNTD